MNQAIYQKLAVRQILILINSTITEFTEHPIWKCMVENRQIVAIFDQFRDIAILQLKFLTLVKGDTLYIKKNYIS